MSRFVRELADSAYYRGMKIPHLLPRNIDEKTKKAVTSSGGTWAPVTPIYIFGEGLELQSSMVLSGTAQAAPAAGKAFIFGDDDYFKLGTPNARGIDCSPVFATTLTQGRGFVPSTMTGPGGGPPPDAVPSLVNAFWPYPDGIPRNMAMFVRVPIIIPDGTRLTQVILYFTVGQTHTAIPQYLPRMRVARIAKDGVITGFPGGTTVGVDPDGWCSPPQPASAAAWNNALGVQSFTMTFDPNGAPVDRSLYDFAFEFYDESGTNGQTAVMTNNRLHHIQVSVKHFDLRPW